MAQYFILLDTLNSFFISLPLRIIGNSSCCLRFVFAPAKQP